MLHVLKRVVGTRIGPIAQGLVTERFCVIGVELFMGITRVAPTVAKYWLEASERIMNDLDCTFAQKLRSALSMLRDEAYQWWLTIEQGLKPELVT